jgi:hypothetical protein
VRGVSSLLKSLLGIMAIPRRRPFTDLWYKVYRAIVREGHFLCGLPFSITNDTHCLLSIPPGSDRRFKLFMVYFTFFILVYVLNYIYVIVWGSEDDFKEQAICVCYTFVDLVVWWWMVIMGIKSRQLASLINNMIGFAGDFNGMRHILC